MSGSTVRFSLLGRFSVLAGSEEFPPAAFGGRLVRALVRILLTRRGMLVPKDVLADALWGERQPADPGHNLEILIARARRALRDPALIETGPGGYLFTDSPACVVDAECFVTLSEGARRDLEDGRPAEALNNFRDALKLWTGDPLPEDTYAQWAQETRRELARRYIDALEGAAAAALATSLPSEAIAYAERAAGREALREISHLLLARAFAASGDNAAAIRVLAGFRNRLAEELGLDPSPEFEEVQTRILRGEVVPASIGTVVPVLAPSMPSGGPAFVGRAAELAALLDTGSGTRIVLVPAPAGTGKSRLLAEAVARAPASVLSVRAFAAERDETWSLARSLLREALALDVAVARAVTAQAARALSNVLPEMKELREVPDLSIDPESQRALALEGAVRIIEASGAGLVLIDDLQWADATSLVLLGSVADRTGVRLGLAYRAEEVSPQSTLGRTLDGLRQRGAHELTLGPLTAEVLAELVADADLARVIAEETDGTPLAILEVLRSLATEGLIEPTVDARYVVRDPLAARRGRQAARDGHRRAIQLRAERLPPTARAELERLALARRELPARLLALAAGRDQMQTLDTLDGLVRAALARLGEAGWATAHDLIADTITDALPPRVRARRHAELADALRTEGADPAEIARHLVGAGDRAARHKLEASRKDTRRIMRSCRRRKAVPVRARRFRGSRSYATTRSGQRVRCATRTEGVVYRDILGWTLGSYRLRKTWCWRRHRITDHPHAEIYGDTTTPGAIVGWAYVGQVAGGHHTEPYNGWRMGSHVSWSQGHFSVCILKVGCYNNPVPSVRIQGIFRGRARVEVRK